MKEFRWVIIIIIIIIIIVVVVVVVVVVVMQRSLMVRWVVGSNLYGGLIELFLVPASAPRLV